MLVALNVLVLPLELAAQASDSPACATYHAIMDTSSLGSVYNNDRELAMEMIADIAAQIPSCDFGLLELQAWRIAIDMAHHKPYDAFATMQVMDQEMAADPSISETDWLGLKVHLDYNMGMFFQNMNNLPSAEGSYRNAMRNLDEMAALGDSTQLYMRPIAIRQIGMAHLRASHWQQAKVIMLNALESERNIAQRALTYRHLGHIALKQRQFQEAEAYLADADRIFTDYYRQRPERYSRGRNNISALRMTQAELAQAKAQGNPNSIHLESAETYLWQADTALIDGDAFAYRVYEAYGELRILQERLPEARDFLERAIDACQALPERAKLLNRISSIAYNEGALEDALQINRKAIALYVDEGDAPDPMTLPVLSEAGNRPYLLSMLNQRTTILSALAKASPQASDTYYLQAAHETNILAQRLMTGILQYADFQRDKEQIINDAYASFEQSISVAYDLYQNTGQQSFLDDAFGMAEKSKAVTLQRVLGEAFQLRDQLPGGEFEEVYQAYRDLLSARLILENAEQEQVDSRTLNQFTAAYEQAQSRYQELRESLDERKIGLLENLSSSVKELQQYLSEDRSLVSYFIGDESSYVFVLNATGAVQCARIEANYEKLSRRVQPLYQALANQTGSLNEHVNWANQSHDLYTDLLAPVADHLRQRLTILPDGPLWKINFETLLSGPLSSDYRTREKVLFSDLPYLLNDHIISYTYSANSLLYTLPNTDTQLDFLGFGPFFSGGPQAGPRYPGLSPLPEEVEAMLQQMGQHYSNPLVKVGPDAQESTLLEYLPECRYACIHTHSIPLDEEEFAIATEPVQKQQWLEMKDIYSLQLTAEYLAMNICHSGDGAELRGQGVVSLARAFLIAGAKSVSASIWKGHEASVRQISSAVFDYIKQGVAQDEALQLAKQDFLQQHANGKQAFPYYWSGVVMLGDMEARSQMGRSWWSWGLFLIAGLFAMLILYRRPS